MCSLIKYITSKVSFILWYNYFILLKKYKKLYTEKKTIRPVSGAAVFMSVGHR